MENSRGALRKGDLMELPPGFRFHPTDEELVTHYLSRKVADHKFSPIAIGDVDMNKVEPWELPWRAKMGEKEWYFFCVRDKKYPTGLRTNRATASGYWKATGKDKEIFRGKTLVGMKKTLVFYRGRAPKGGKSNWVCHEYRLDSKPRSIKDDWVISRVFQKTSGGKKVHISGLMRANPPGDDLPALMDVNPRPDGETGSVPTHGHVHCFSNPTFTPPEKTHDGSTANFFTPSSFYPSSSTAVRDSFPVTASPFPWAAHPGIGFPIQGSATFQDPASLMRSVLASYGPNENPGPRTDRVMVSASQETAMSTENSSAVSNFEMGKTAALEEEEEEQRMEFIWNY